jgi:putative transposase
MYDELSARQQAIRLRLAGESVESLCYSLKRSERWVHKWWQRYLPSGPEGLYDLTRAHQRVVNRTPPPIERAVLGVRRRLAARATPHTRDSLVGAPTIREELKRLGVTPLPAIRTIDRILARADLTCPPVRLARRLAQSDYPGPQAHASNQRHQVDVVGPRSLKGDKTAYYFLICKDRFDQAVYIEFVDSREMNRVLTFLVHTWQHLGLPARVQFDNGREFCGWGRWPRSLSRVIRLCLHLGIEPVFIPEGEPQRHGSVAQFHGWFQPLLLRHRFRHPGEVRREVRRLMTRVNEPHVHPQLGYQTPAKHRRSQRLRKRPADFALEARALPMAAGKIPCVRRVSGQGTINSLGERLKSSKRWKFQYIRATLSTETQRVRVYQNGRLLKQLSYKLRKN